MDFLAVISAKDTIIHNHSYTSLLDLFVVNFRSPALLIHLLSRESISDLWHYDNIISVSCSLCFSSQFFSVLFIFALRLHPLIDFEIKQIERDRKKEIVSVDCVSISYVLFSLKTSKYSISCICSFIFFVGTSGSFNFLDKIQNRVS